MHSDVLLNHVINFLRRRRAKEKNPRGFFFDDAKKLKTSLEKRIREFIARYSGGLI